MERVIREDLVVKSVEGLLVLPGNHHLVASVVHVNSIARWYSGPDHDLVVRRPEGTELESPDDDQAHEEKQRGHHNRLPATQQQDRQCQNGEPGERRQGEESDDRETGDS